MSLRNNRGKFETAAVRRLQSSDEAYSSEFEPKQMAEPIKFATGEQYYGLAYQNSYKSGDYSDMRDDDSVP